MLLRVLHDIFGGWKARARGDNKLLAAEHLQQGAASRSAGMLQDALAHFKRAVDLAPDDPDCLHAFTEVDDLLKAHTRFPGETYFAVLARILEEVKPRTYLETGVAAGDSLRLVRSPTLAIGIDPEPQIVVPLAPNQRVFAETSDSFFASRDVRAELGGLPIDLAFIDGMHHFEYALRDFANIERHATPQSTILIHDCYPLDRVTAERDRQRSFWSGDVWRLIVLLKKYRPELAIHTIATAPTGLVMVRRLDPGSRLLLERHNQLREEFLALDYSYLEQGMAEKLNLFPNDWTKVRALLA